MAAVLDRTDDERILQVNCLRTDFCHGPAYPTYLYYNPYGETREVPIDAGAAPVDLYDTTRHAFVNRRVSGRISLRLDPDSAALVVLAPSGGVVTRHGGKLLVDGVIVDYRYDFSRNAATAGQRGATAILG
jgi:hypothetical protein